MDQINFKATLICKEDLRKALQCVSDTKLGLIISAIDAPRERAVFQIIQKLFTDAENWNELMKRREKNDGF